MDRRDGVLDLGGRRATPPLISVFVPVLGRAHQIRPLLHSLAGNTSVDVQVVFICTHDDPTLDEVRARQLEFDTHILVAQWDAGRADFAKKINAAYELTESTWVFQGATDLAFRRGWDREALIVGKRGYHVIGTNDLGNPLVRRGLHSTHTLFSREYIETHGGTHDDSGKVFCELYDHEFVDTEFIERAKLIGLFKGATRSVVEHLHPHWGKGEMDTTYEKSVREFQEDAAIYNVRMREIRELYHRR